MRSWHVLKILVILMVCTATIDFPVHAEIMSQWVPDQKVPGYLDDTFTPYLLADQNRTVHAFASQWVDDGDRRLAIIYRKWSLAGGWTRPVDVLLAPSGDANFLSAFLDIFGMMHVLFSNGYGRGVVIYYANAPAAVADSALAWSTPQVIGGGIFDLNSAALTGDDQGNLVFIYSGNIDGNGVYALHSSDFGQTWSEPVAVFQTQDAELVPFSLRLFPGQERQIRAAWNVVTMTGVDELLYFSNYDGVAGIWSKPIRLDKKIDLPNYFGPSYPAIVDNGQELVILYNAGNPLSGQPAELGRPVQRSIVSIDGGKTWSEPSTPFPFLVGRSGQHTMVLDGAGGPHTLFIQRIDRLVDGVYKPIDGIWHSEFRGGIWSNPDRLVTTTAPADVRSIVSQGNALLVVWRDDPGLEKKFGIWYSYAILEAPELPIVPLPTVVLTNNVNQQSVTNTSPIPISTTTPVQLTDKQQSILTTAANPGSTLIYGVLPVVLLLMSVIVLYSLRARK